MIPNDHVQGPPCPFRAAGFTWEAGLLPLSPEALDIVAEHNGVKIEQLPRGARNAPNPYMLSWLHALGTAKSEGRPHRHASGRFLFLGEMA